jgi:DNA-binding CsgD family transcriptional regulator
LRNKAFVLGGKIKIPPQLADNALENISAGHKLNGTNTVKVFGKNGDLFIGRFFDLKKNIDHASRFIIFNNVRVNKDTEILLKEFFLSPSQARLACLIANGESIKDASLTLNITEGTARQMIKEIFSKTGVNSQAKLVSFVRDISNIAW